MSQMEIIHLIEQYGYFGIGFLIALENVFPPIPSEVVLIFTGYLTTASNLTILNSVIAATVGAYVGAIVLFGIGRLLDEDRISRLVSGRFGKIIHLRPDQVDRAGHYFNNHGGKAIFFGRFIPVVRSLISIPAGMVRYSFWRFSVLTISGTLIWNGVLITTGHYVGYAWQTSLRAIDDWSLIIGGIIIVLAIGYWWFKRKTKK